MKPNGVFFGTGSKWQVLGSNTFFNTVGDRPQFGTQSGPLLFVNANCPLTFRTMARPRRSAMVWA